MKHKCNQKDKEKYEDCFDCISWHRQEKGWSSKQDRKEVIAEIESTPIDNGDVDIDDIMKVI